ncbi:thioredoxin domain-containing protein [Tissierella sp. Yu-01]|uniref:thioredoxin family protein n=1 Tax=Tissierella sp. Yu-01 TaxID=3035694 RepID=UPI00240D2751|nr:thioredoxin domain-containing protein [Tissierella sp. Yu-01]WFA10215.1 thioredoxin domain-containing protein [Tissierella sp. Yu-01]
MLAVNNENFEQEVLNADGVVLVDFWSPACVSCKALMPHIHKFEEEFGSKIKFTSLDTSKARRLAISQEVRGLPAIAIYKSGEKVDLLSSSDANPQTIEGLIKKYI